MPEAPEKPTISDITADSMTVSWSPPEEDGGSPITGYILEKRDVSSKRWLKASSDAITELTFKFTGLSKGSSYEFRVSAQNKAGTGKPSIPSDVAEAKPPYGIFYFILMNYNRTILLYLPRHPFKSST